MSHARDRARFARQAQSFNGWKFARFKMRNYFHGQATIAASAGDFTAEAARLQDVENVRLLGPSLGPPVPIADRRPVPPASTEEPARSSASPPGGSGTSAQDTAATPTGE